MLLRRFSPLRHCFSSFLLSVMVIPVFSQAVTLTGDLQQGAMIIGQAQSAAKVTLNGKRLKVSDAGLFVFGLDRDAKPGDKLEVIGKDGAIWQQSLEVKPREYKIQRVEGISKKIMSKKKSDETWARIRREGQEISQARKKSLNLEGFNQSFKWPLIGPITGVFGSQRVYNGEPGRPHYGVDVAAAVGTPVGSPADGVITYADDMYYSGGTAVIDHGFGISSSFLHMSKILVKVGDTVKQGDVIGEVGAGGRASGPHLDWRMNWFKRRIDPQLLVPAMAKKSEQ
ncbi:MAG: M23 family metallopeptidase [Pseudomonadales bacterium]|nr:M23 family metallopeptidase [Pseudomonadales bacterium]